MTSFNQRLVQEWQAQGHRVKVLNYSLQYPSILFPGSSQLTEAAAPEGLDAERLLNSMGPWSWWRSALWVVRQKPDLILIRYWTPWMAPALGVVMRRIRSLGCKVPRLLLADNLQPHESLPLTGMLNRWVLGAADGLVTLSEAVGRQAPKFGYHGPRLVLKHPVYDHFGPAVDRAAACRRLDLDPQDRYLLFFGLVRAYKGLDLLLQALAHPAFPFWNSPEGRHWKLIVAGEFYESQAPYLRFIQELHLEQRVVLRPNFVPDQEVSNYFSVAEALILPYRHATQSGVTQAALHFGLPLVVTRVGGLAEDLEGSGAGELCRPETGDLAAALQRLCAAPSLEPYRAAMQALRESFGWGPFAAELLRFGREIR